LRRHSAPRVRWMVQADVGLLFGLF
jgi:hypothetical protein